MMSRINRRIGSHLKHSADMLIDTPQLHKTVPLTVAEAAVLELDAEILVLRQAVLHLDLQLLQQGQ